MGRGYVIKDEVEFTKMWCDPSVMIVEIAAHFGVGHSSIYQTAKRYRLPSSKVICRPMGVAPKLVDTADLQRRYEAGEAVVDLAHDFKATKGIIYHMVSKNGWRRHSEARESRMPPARLDVPEGVEKAKFPSPAVLEASFTLRRLDGAQIEALAESGGRYAVLDDLARLWGKNRCFVGQCWHDFKAAV